MTAETHRKPGRPKDEALQTRRREEILDAAGFQRLDRKRTRLNSSHANIPYAVFCLERKSTRLNSSHANISYAVFCLNKNTTHRENWMSADFLQSLGITVPPGPAGFLSGSSTRGCRT